MATTTVQPLPYPSPTGVTPDVPRDIKALAEAVENRLVMRFASLAARDAALPSGTLVDGMMCHVASENAVYLRSGGQWRLLWIDTGWINVPLASGFTYDAQPQVRRVGQVVYWRGDVKGAFTTSIVTVAAVSSLPSWAIPPRNWRDTETSLPCDVRTTTAFGLVDNGNGVRIATGASATTRVSLKGLSGYTVD